MEIPVATAKANVMLYDGDSKSWIASGPENGVSKVQLYRNETSNTYRIVGWRLQDREVVINCALLRGLQYNEARPTFHQWRDSKKQVYGLNFISTEEATTFASAVRGSLDHLNSLHQQLANKPQVGLNNDNSHAMRALQPAYNSATIDRVSPMGMQPFQHGTLPGEYQFPSINGSTYSNRSGQNSGVATDAVYGGSASVGYASDNKFYSSSDDSVKGLVVGPGAAFANLPFTSGGGGGPLNDLATSLGNMQLRQSEANSSASLPNPTVPPAPPPPPPLLGGIGASSRTGRPTQRASVTTAPAGLLAGADDGDDESGDSPVAATGFAAQLQQAVRQQRLRAASLAPASSEPGTDAVTVNNNAIQGGPVAGTIGRDNPPGSADMLSALRQVLAARRRAQEAEVVVSNEPVNNSTSVAGNNRRTGSGDALSSSRWNSVSGVGQSQLTGDSVVPSFATLRKHSSPALETTMGPPPPPPPMPPKTVITSVPPTPNGQNNVISRADLEQFKRELLSEFRREVQQLKNDVIEALRTVVSQ